MTIEVCNAPFILLIFLSFSVYKHVPRDPSAQYLSSLAPVGLGGLEVVMAGAGTAGTAETGVHHALAPAEGS